MDAEVIQLVQISAKHLSQGQNKKAWMSLERAASLLRPEMDERVKTFTLINLASCLARMKNFMKAAECLGRALNRLDDLWLKTCVLVNLAAVKSELGFWQEALEIDLTVLRYLKEVPDGINKATVEVVICRNVAVVCLMLNQGHQVRTFESRARELAMKNLGPSNLLTMVVERFKVLEVSPSQFRAKKEKKNERFLKKIRFITGERLQPMHNNRNAWTKRLKSLHLKPIGLTNQSNEEKRNSSRSLVNQNMSNISELVENIRKGFNKVRNQTQDSQNLLKFEEKIVESMKNSKHKSIKIVNFKDLGRNKEKNKAAVVIQKNFRMFSQRQKYLLFKKIGRKIEYRMETLDMFNPKKLASLAVKESEEYEENDLENEGSDKKIEFKQPEVPAEKFHHQDSNILKNLKSKEVLLNDDKTESPETIERNSEKIETQGKKNEELKSSSDLSYSEDFKSNSSEKNSLLSSKLFETQSEQAALKIQRHYRSYLSQKFRGYPIKASTRAIIKIQKAFRSFKINQQ